MDWQKAKALGENGYKIPDRWLFLHYYEALNILFRVENSLRVFVYAVLKNASFDQWVNTQVVADDTEKQDTISTLAKKRRQQARTFGYLGYAVSCPIMHLTGGELVRVMLSASGWKLFAEHFHGGKEIIGNKLDEIAHIRNSLAHFRPISEDDVEVIRQNAKQVLIGVEEYLSQMMEQTIVVPSNSNDDWYKKLAVLGTEDCTLRLNQSNDELWIRILMSFSLRIPATRIFHHDGRRSRLISPVKFPKGNVCRLAG